MSKNYADMDREEIAEERARREAVAEAEKRDLEREAEMREAREAYGGVDGGAAGPGASVARLPRGGSWQESNEKILDTLERGDGLGHSGGKVEFSRWVGQGSQRLSTTRSMVARTKVTALARQPIGRSRTTGQGGGRGKPNRALLLEASLHPRSSPRGGAWACSVDGAPDRLRRSVSRCRYGVDLPQRQQRLHGL